MAEISAMLGREPNSSGDIGELTPAGRAGRDLKPQYLRYQRTYWALGLVEDEGTGDDHTGFAALRALVAELGPSAHALAELRRGGETVLWWYGDSDSTQGGFVLDAELISALAKLGCDLFGTAYLDESEDEEQ